MKDYLQDGIIITATSSRLYFVPLILRRVYSFVQLSNGLCRVLPHMMVTHVRQNALAGKVSAQAAHICPASRPGEPGQQEHYVREIEHHAAQGQQAVRQRSLPEEAGHRLACHAGDDHCVHIAHDAHHRVGEGQVWREGEDRHRDDEHHQRHERIQLIEALAGIHRCGIQDVPQGEKSRAEDEIPPQQQITGHGKAQAKGQHDGEGQLARLGEGGVRQVHQAQRHKAAGGNALHDQLAGDLHVNVGAGQQCRQQKDIQGQEELLLHGDAPLFVGALGCLPLRHQVVQPVLAEDATLHVFRDAAVFFEDVDMLRHIIQIDVSAHIPRQAEFVVGHGIGREHDLLAGEAAGFGQHQLGFGGAVHASALFLEDTQDRRVGQGLDGEVLLEIGTPGKGGVQVAGIAAQSGFIVEVEGRGKLLRRRLENAVSQGEIRQGRRPLSQKLACSMYHFSGANASISGVLPPATV